MKYKAFRNFKISRSCEETFNSYKNYKCYLKKDFHSRCAYCNIKDTDITTPFEIDHFVPRKEFENIRDDLDTLYDNLMYTCKKCNIAKASKFEGDLTKNKVTNNLFYDPVEIDYNDIFYRTKIGAINSDDKKGRKMIELLKLYRPIHNLAWVCEELLSTIDKLKKKISETENIEQKSKLEESLCKLSTYYIEFNNVFLANYNNKEFKINEQ